jgi:hypothetical protein
MATLSKKQQANIEHMWELEARVNQLTIAMADAVRGPLELRKVWQARIDALEEQVPESVQDTWDKVDVEHGSFPSEAARESWLEAYSVLQSAAK